MNRIEGIMLIILLKFAKNISVFK